MTWLNVGIAAIGAVGGIMGGNAASSASKSSKRLGRENAKYIGQETDEEKRRLTESQEQDTGKAKVSIAGSGFRSGKKSMGGSHRAYLADLERTQKAEMDWLTKSGASRQKIAKLGGLVESKALKASAVSSYASAANSVISGYDAWKNR